jgi:hypothetical protein
MKSERKERAWVSELCYEGAREETDVPCTVDHSVSIVRWNSYIVMVNPELSQVQWGDPAGEA